MVVLTVAPAEGWKEIRSYLQRRPDLASRILGEFAGAEHVAVRGGGDEESLRSIWSTSQIGELTQLLIQFFPFDADPVHKGAYKVGPNEAARRLRDQLLGWLSQQRDLEAVLALREIEQRFGTRFHP